MNCLCRPSKTISVRIILLDDTDFTYEVKDDLPGQTLLDVVFTRLNLIETAYFGIRYIDEDNQTHWLDPACRLSRQLKGKTEPFSLYFGVKFYAADPCKLVEEITRYQLFLQVKQDVLQGRLPVSFELAAELGAFVVQSELGDYDPRRHSSGYVSEFRLLSNQTSELEARVSELHQQLKGMSPAAAELNYLDKVKWHDMYGVDLHPVLGEDSVEYYLGLTPSGIVVLRNKTTVAHYYWPRIAKVYFKGRYFMLRVCDKNSEMSTYGFETPRKSACKHLWRCCVEHHAFFRLVRVAPMQTQTGTTDLFSLGSRFRYSGRTEKQAMKDALMYRRAPPVFTRVPSKRQPRRVIDDLLLLDAAKKVNENFIKTQEIKTISIPQPAQTYENPYRSTYSIPTTLGIRPYNSNGSTNGTTPDSPRSTRSAPWPRSQQRSLFGNPPSPRSVRSASTTARNSLHVPTHRFRSSSVESHSSNDSRSARRHKHRHRRTSDNESELSRGSGRSHHSHRKHRRSRHRRDSGSENDSTARARSYSGHRISTGSIAELVDSTHQWKEVQRKQADLVNAIGQQSIVQQASVTKSSSLITTKSLIGGSGYSDSHSDSHSQHHHNHKARRHRKNRSPSNLRNNRIWSSELAKHLQFDLVDTTGMTEDQLREIPYTVVETHSSSKRFGSQPLKVHKSSNSSNSNNNHGHTNQTKDRVDRIRGLYFQNTNPNDSTGTKSGSIRSASTVSSRECDRNSGLVRMMSSMSMGDFISPSASSLSPLDNNSVLRVSHEHTDSGLGADQDYAYSSERSSDSTRYGTNKSSGASSGSHHKSTINNFTGPGTHHSVSNKKPPMCPNRQQQQQSQQQQNQQIPKPSSSPPPTPTFSSSTSQQHFHKYSSPLSEPVYDVHIPTVMATNNGSGGSNNKDNCTSSNCKGNSDMGINNSLINTNITVNREGSNSSGAKNNNRLINCTTLINNHYTFSLNRSSDLSSTNHNCNTNKLRKGKTATPNKSNNVKCKDNDSLLNTDGNKSAKENSSIGGGGDSFENTYYNSLTDNNYYLIDSTRPLSSFSSLYSGNYIKVSRGTKSDIGVPIRSRQSKFVGNNINNIHGSCTQRSRLPSIKSDLVLSYVRGSSQNNLTTDENPYHVSGLISSVSDFIDTSYNKTDKSLRNFEHVNSNKIKRFNIATLKSSSNEELLKSNYQKSFLSSSIEASDNTISGIVEKQQQLHQQRYQTQQQQLQQQQLQQQQQSQMYTQQCYYQGSHYQQKGYQHSNFEESFMNNPSPSSSKLSSMTNINIPMVSNNSVPSCNSTLNPSNFDQVSGPLMFVDGKPNICRNDKRSSSQFQTTSASLSTATVTRNSPCGEGLLGATTKAPYQHNHKPMNSRAGSNSSEIPQTNRSSSLELILTPIIQSSRRAQ